MEDSRRNATTSNVQSPVENTKQFNFLTSEVDSSEIQLIDMLETEQRTQARPLPVNAQRAQEMQEVVQRVIAERNQRANDPNYLLGGKKWCFTWNNPPQEWQSKLAQLTTCKNLKIQFIVAEMEQGEITNTPHIQGYLRSGVRIYYRTLVAKLTATGK